MERYSEYKDSGVKWLGEIPSHWEVMPIKHISKVNSGATPKTSVQGYWDGNITWVTPADFKTDTKFVLKGNRNITSLGVKSCSTVLLPKGSLVFSKRAPIGQVSISKLPLCTNQGCFGIIPNESMNNCFLYYSLAIHAKSFNTLGSGTTFRELSFSAFSSYKISVPPKAEQDAIVRYLDAATSKIDKAIAMQQKMIDLLNERKQIIIQNAVTKGIDENVEMKDSGVEWIGMIPKHWEISKLKYLIDAPLKYGANEASDLIDYSCPRYIRITDIDTNGKLKEETYRSLPMNKAEPYLLKKGDLLFARSGATVGKAFLFEEDYAACYAGYLIKAHMDLQKVLPKFVYLYTQTFAYQRWKESIFIQATIQNISGERYANMQIPMPTLEEQNNIIDMLTPKMLRFDSVISNCQRQITLLQERKQIIINEVVTGKVKVS